MISSPWVKARILDLFVGRPLGAGVARLYGAPEKGSDVIGSDPLFEQMIAFSDPDGAMTIDELCGPGVTTYMEAYDLEVILQVVAKTRDVGFAEVEQRRAQLVWELSRVLQDPSLGYTDGDSDLFEQPIVTITDFVGVSGWLPTSGTNLAATRGVVQLMVEADIKAEA